MMPADLNHKVALALGWKDKYPNDAAVKCGWLTPQAEWRCLPDFSTDPDYIGGLLLEAQKRGWLVEIHSHGSSGFWRVKIRSDRYDDRITSQSLPEAICHAFIAAHEAEKVGVQ